MLYQVTSSYFCAAIVVVDGLVVEAAPILKKYKGSPLTKFVDYCKQRNWSIHATEN